MLTSELIKQRFLTDLFAAYDEQGIQYCVLRGFESLPERVESADVDIVVAPEHRSKNRTVVLELAKRHNTTLYNMYVDERFDQLYFCKRVSPSDLFELKLDFFFQSELYGVRLVDARDIIRTRVRYRSFWVAHDVYGFLDKWLFIYLLGAPLPRRYAVRFRDVVAQNGVVLRPLLGELLGYERADSLIESIRNHGFENLPRLRKSELALILARQAARTPGYHARHLAEFLTYRLRYFCWPMGEFVSVSGGSAAERTEILAHAKGELERLFRADPTDHGHLRPNVFTASTWATGGNDDAFITESDQQDRHARSAVLSQVAQTLTKSTLCLVDFICGYFVKIRPSLTKRQVVVYDRYVYDALSDPACALMLPAWARNVAMRAVPKPGAAFLIRSNTPMSRASRVSTREPPSPIHGSTVTLDPLSPLEAAASLVDTVIDRRRERLRLSEIGP